MNIQKPKFETLESGNPPAGEISARELLTAEERGIIAAFVVEIGGRKYLVSPTQTLPRSATAVRTSGILAGIPAVAGGTA